MKRGILDQGGNHPKRFKSNSTELCAIISELYDAGGSIVLNNADYQDDIQHLLSYIDCPQTLETAFNQMPHQCLKVATYMANTFPEYLKALLNNERILPKINVHETIDESPSVFKLASLLVNTSDLGHHTGALFYLLEKIPLSILLFNTSDEKKQATLKKAILANPLMHPNLISTLQKQEMFCDFIKNVIADPWLCSLFYQFASIQIAYNPHLLECLLLQDEALTKTKQMIEENHSLLHHCITSAIQCAKKGDVAVLNKILLYIDQSPFNTKLQTLQKVGLKKLFIDLLMISQSNPALKEKIHTYLTAQDIQIDALEKEILEVEWENAIDNIDIIEVTRLIERNDCPPHLPVITWALEKARKLLVVHRDKTDASEKILEIFLLLARKNINPEALHLGLTPLFHAIDTDLTFNTNFTLLLLENASVNINAQCTYDIFALLQKLNMNGISINTTQQEILSPFPLDMTPLHFCFYTRKLAEKVTDSKLKELVQTLLCYKCNIDLRDESGLSIREIMNAQSMDEISHSMTMNQPKGVLLAFLKTQGPLIKECMKELHDNYEAFADVVNLLSKPKNYQEEEGIHPGLPPETIAQICDLAFCPTYKTQAILEKNVAAFIECKNNAKQETNDSNAIKHSL